MRVKGMTIAIVVLAVGAAPALAAQTNALRNLPKPVVARSAVTTPVAFAPAAAPVTIRPSAVWIPSPAAGIKWTAPAPKPVKSTRFR